MITYPLKSLTLNEAMTMQFRLVDCITQEFEGHEILTRGDLGVVAGLNKPNSTLQAERAVARFFESDKAIFVRGSGTSAIRYALFSVMSANEVLLVHKAPIYSTSKTSIEMLGLKVVEADFNDLNNIEQVMKQHPEIKAALVQITRQKLDDSYDLQEVITKIKTCAQIPVVTDDNYAAMKIAKIGVQCGGDLSCFSTFKLLGPEGIGCIVGKAEFVDMLIKHHYSGGSQTQGWEALEALRGLVYAPVALAIQAQVNEECVRRLNDHEIPHIKDAFLANAQSKVLLVEFDEEIAEAVLVEAEKLGAAPNPIGAESKYELTPMFYRVSGTVMANDPSIVKRMIRINPMRCGSDTILRILDESIKKVTRCL